MKMGALKTVAFGITMTIMAASTGVFADQDDRFLSNSNDSSENFKRHSDDKRCFNPRTVERLKARLRTLLEIQFASLNNIYTFLGASTNPNPATNPAVSGLINANSRIINLAGTKAITVLGDLGVPQSALNVIAAQTAAFFTDAINYALAVNLANTGQPAGNQIVLALALENDALAVGTSLLALTHNPEFSSILAQVANLTTQDVQAYRGVLADGNVFGANPSNPASETAAAVAINALIAQLIAQLANNLVPELAHDKCSGDF